MPVENRLDMELTGIKTAVGIKIQGPDLAHIEDIGAHMQQILSGMPETNSVFAERVAQGFYLNVEVNRPQAARYGLTVADVQQVITSEIGGADIAQNVEGRERFPIAVRYQRNFRDHPEALSQALIPTPSGEQIPISEVARVYYSRGPAMIRDEDGALTGYVYLNLNTHNYGGFVSRAQTLINQKLALPAGYTWRWAGEYEFEMRAKQRLKIILPIVFFVIFLLLYLVFKSAAEAAVLIFPTLYAMSGGLLLQWALGYNFSVAVWVGYIALFGIAVETGVVMVVYLDEAFQNAPRAGCADDGSRLAAGGDRWRGAAAAAQADDRDGGDSEPCADPLGNRHRFRRDEAHCCSHRRRNDHIHHSRPDSRSGILPAHQAQSLAPRPASRKPESATGLKHGPARMTLLTCHTLDATQLISWSFRPHFRLHMSQCILQWELAPFCFR